MSKTFPHPGQRRIGFIDHVIGERNSDLLRENGAGAMGDVGEWAGMDQRGVPSVVWDEIGKKGSLAGPSLPPVAPIGRGYWASAR